MQMDVVLFSHFIQGCYLAALASRVEADSRGTVFGSAYGVSTLLSLLLSLPGNGVLCAGAPSVACCLALLATVLLIVRMGETSAHVAQEPEALRTSHDAARGETLVVVAATIAVAGVVKTIGFSFPSSDLLAGFSLELTRVLYGMGMVVVGMVADRDRRLAMAVCAASLVAPFLMLSLSGYGVTGMLLWLLGYLLAGVYVLFSVLVAVDLACDAGCPELAGLGMAVRYVGDALGTALFLSLSDTPAALVAVSGVAFVAAATLFVLLYRQRYSQDASPAARERTERERFVLFATGYALTQRERDVLRLILDEKSNSEIAGELVITERTVKFHVSNLLKKTECKTRNDVLAKYAQLS